MKALWPKSLFGQLMLLVALALFVAQAINFAMLVRAGERLRFAEAAGPVIARVVTVAERLETGEPVLPQRFRRRAFVRIDDRSAVRTESHDRVPTYEQRLASGLETAGFSPLVVEVGRVDVARMPPPRRFERRMNHRRPPDILRVSAQLQDGRWINSWMRIRPGGIGALISIIAQTVILYGVLLFVLFLFARRVSRPLRSLTGAVRDFSDGTDAAPVPVEGPRDVASLIEAFNAMRVRIAAMLGEKDHMLGAIGHDLRTPLAALRIHAENVPDEAERRRMVETIADMTETLDDILSLARLGRPNAESEPLDLTALVDSAIEDFRDVGAPVELEDSERLVVNGRANLLKRAIRNLIDNAVRYGGSATVRLRRSDGTVVIEVDDEGPGIDEAALESVFEPFARLEGSRNREQGGSGLGLALARAIVREHGGELNLENLSGHGLKACLSLPLRDE
ncbi:HAMP domain-containing histidine kinase [Parasphingopyxis algicola]|uniref:sensor histidine kinase n=1 Tax=Parasphingopyxis algicola TaxID=2026624 RepID=UPI0015A2DC22|nr:HAMP domain-containing sensor histidine kinase [Parasphingopyxis algicola]QLC24838.1 HAMP domain-containing histidine kinase [Parasphingopyxis algicola]